MFVDLNALNVPNQTPTLKNFSAPNVTPKVIAWDSRILVPFFNLYIVKLKNLNYEWTFADEVFVGKY